MSKVTKLERRAAKEAEAARKEAEDLAVQEVIDGLNEISNRRRQEERKTSRGFNINNFRSEIGKNGVLATHSFVLFINTDFIPGTMPTNADGDGGDMLAMRCDTASVPGVNFMLNDTISRYGYGPLTRMPYAAQFNVLNLNFIVDEAAHILKFWDEWMNKVVYHRSKGGKSSVMNSKSSQDTSYSKLQSVNGYSPYEVGYKSGVGGYAIPQMTLQVYDRKQFKVMEIVFYDAFPIQKNDINLSWGEQDTAMRFQVALAYTDFDVTYSKLISATEYTSDGEEEILVNGKRSLLGKLKDNVVKSTVDAVGESLVRSVSRIKIF
jgi:hypothetical protein